MCYEFLINDIQSHHIHIKVIQKLHVSAYWSVTTASLALNVLLQQSQTTTFSLKTYCTWTPTVISLNWKGLIDKSVSKVLNIHQNTLRKILFFQQIIHNTGDSHCTQTRCAKIHNNTTVGHNINHKYCMYA